MKSTADIYIAISVGQTPFWVQPSQCMRREQSKPNLLGPQEVKNVAQRHSQKVGEAGFARKPAGCFPPF